MLRILWCGFGLGVATLCILLATLFVPILPRVVTWHDPKGLLALFIVDGLFTGLVMYPTFAFAAYVRSKRSITSPYYWICAGGIVALFVNLCVAVIFGPYTDFMIINSSMPAGLIGGLVYSLFHDTSTFRLMMGDCKQALSKVVCALILKTPQTETRPALA